MNTVPDNESNNPFDPAGESLESQQSSPEFTQDDFASPAELENMSSEQAIEELKTQLADAEKRVLLAQADLENFRRRTRRDMQDQIRYASLGLMGEILEAVDNLSRAIESYESDPNGEGLVDGVKLVAQQISTVLENHGCKKIEAIGQPFDPSLHQALQMQASEDHAPNTVVLDLRPGFQLHDRVIRPSQVFVSTGNSNS
jgi:molecular chaperone GrpE